MTVEQEFHCKFCEISYTVTFTAPVGVYQIGYCPACGMEITEEGDE